MNDDERSFSREGVRDHKPYKVTFVGDKKFADDVNEFFSTAESNALLLVPRKTLQKLLVSDEHQTKQVRELQQRGTELLEELRLYRRLALTDSQKEFVISEMKTLKERLAKSYGQTAVGSEE